jgi:HEAT repeat protein
VKDLLESKDAGVRFNAAHGLAQMKSPAAVGPLAKVCTEDEHVMVRRVAARALGDIRAWRAVPVLIQALEDREVYVAQQANFALQKITGQDFGVTLDSSPRDRKTRAVTATKWWDKNKDSPPEGVCLEPITPFVNVK